MGRLPRIALPWFCLPPGSCPGCGGTQEAEVCIGPRLTVAHALRLRRGLGFPGAAGEEGDTGEGRGAAAPS